jgi:shikimate dehydrogenase
VIDPPPRLVLLGHPVSHSISPRFQNAALRAANIPLVYETLDVDPDALDETLSVLRAERAAGNVTIPLKELVAARCTRRSALAERVGAVNVYWHENGELVGDNSDVGGAEATMRALLVDVVPMRMALLGAGGSAAAVLCAAERCGFGEVRVYNRSMDRAKQVVERVGGVAQAVTSMEEALAGADLVVNATPVGLHGGEMPVPVSMLPDGCAVFDLAYQGTETPWITASRAAGHRAADGLGMLIEQGAIAFRMWFGVEPDRTAMWKAIS